MYLKLQKQPDSSVHAVKAMGRGMVERHGERRDRGGHEPAFTIRASAGGMEPGGFRWRENDVSDPIRLRADEAATLQSYPDGFEFVGNKGQVFQQIGNAVPPLLAQRVLEALWATPSREEMDLAA